MARLNVSVDRWDLETLGALGLYVDEADDGTGTQSYEAAICRVTSSLVEAVAIALAAHASEADLSAGKGSWCEDFEFDADEARIALGGISVMLRHLPRMVEDLRIAQRHAAESDDEEDEDDLPSPSEHPIAPLEDDEPLDPSDPQKCTLPTGPESEASDG